MKRIVIICVLLCIPPTTFATDPFKGIVKAIEKEYGVHHNGIPWFARAIIKPAMLGSGVGAIKLAAFENLPLSGAGSGSRLAEVIERTVGPEWQNVIRVRSRHDDETVYIYFKPVGPKFTMLILNVEPSEASVIQMDVKEKEFEKWMNDTDTMAKRQVRHRRTETTALIGSDTPGGYSIPVP